MSRLLGLEDAKNVLNEQQIIAAMLENGITKLADKDELLLIHDGSDIRKEYANQLENLGKVRDLDGNIINGYSSFNTIAVDLACKDVTLLNSEIYSNRSEDFISQKDLRLIAKPLSKKATPEQAAHYANIKTKVAAAGHINSSIVARQQIKKVSAEFKKTKPNKKLTHIIDRGGDDNELFAYIAKELQDKFVIRLKSSRVSEPDETESAEKLVSKNFMNKQIKYYSKIQVKSKVYQNASCVVEWGECLGGYAVVRVQLMTSEGKSVFKAPMLLITNKDVITVEEAVSIYHIYLKRAKIEGVFKFLKEVLGWEESQIRDFKAIKTLLTFCYFVAGYFYEIESALIENEVIKFIAYLGNGKGKVTRFYILQGFAKMITKSEVDDAIEEFKITPEQIKQIMQLIARRY
jgi:Transposase DDE domain